MSRGLAEHMAMERKSLWVVVALFIAVSLATVVSSSVFFTTLYVALLVAFALLHGSLRYGWEGIAAFVVICLVISNFFENLSVVTGFPFGHYFYTDALGPKLLYVPLLIGPTYLGVGYLSWVLATILVGDVRRDASLPATAAAPLIAAFIMVLWDLNLDPGAATLGKWWIWQQGGGFFGVPLSNYLGWFFTVYVFMQLFALYLRARGPVPEVPQPKSYFAQAIIMYAVIAFLFSIEYAVKGSGEVVTDATGAAWRSGDIRETAAITSLLTMVFVVALAAITIARIPAHGPASEPAREPVRVPLRRVS
jgi:uncharacterized membrane protein